MCAPGRQPRHFLLVKAGGHASNGVLLNAPRAAQMLLDAHIWPLWRFTPNRLAIQVGDRVAVYVSGGVIAIARVAEIASWSQSYSRRYPLALSGTPVSTLVLSDVERLSSPVEVRSIRVQLGLPTKWGAWVMAGCRALTPAQYVLLRGPE